MRKQIYWQKVVMVGSLLAALLFNANFKPQPAQLARHEVNPRGGGAIELATKDGTSQEPRAAVGGGKRDQIKEQTHQGVELTPLGDLKRSEDEDLSWVKFSKGPSGFAYIDLNQFEDGNFEGTKDGKTPILILRDWVSKDGTLQVRMDIQEGTTIERCATCTAESINTPLKPIQNQNKDAIKEIVLRYLDAHRSFFKKEAEAEKEKRSAKKDEDKEKSQEEKDSEVAENDPCGDESGVDLVSCSMDQYESLLDECDLDVIKRKTDRDEYRSSYKDKKASAKKKAAREEAANKSRNCKANLEQAFAPIRAGFSKCAKLAANSVTLGGIRFNAIGSSSLNVSMKSDDSEWVEACNDLAEFAHTVRSESPLVSHVDVATKFGNIRTQVEMNKYERQLTSMGYRGPQLQQAMIEKMMIETGATMNCSNPLMGGYGGAGAYGAAGVYAPELGAQIGVGGAVLPMGNRMGVMGNQALGLGGRVPGCQVSPVPQNIWDPVYGPIQTGGMSLLGELASNPVFDNQNQVLSMFNNDFYAQWASTLRQAWADPSGATGNGLLSLGNTNFLNIGLNGNLGVIGGTPAAFPGNPNFNRIGTVGTVGVNPVITTTTPNVIATPGAINNAGIAIAPMNGAAALTPVAAPQYRAQSGTPALIVH